MRLFIFFILLSLFYIPSSAQECSCEEDFNYVVRFIERNFPGFDKNVTANNQEDYKRYKSAIHKKVKTVESKNECLKYLTYYVEYFKDNHTKMRSSGDQKIIDESSEEALNNFLSSKEYLSTAIVEVVPQQYPLEDIRGIYVSADSTYTIAVVENTTIFRDYVGVIVASKTKLWKKGQVKLELKQKDKDLYEGFAYNRYHNANYLTAIPFKNGFLGDFWIKTNKKNSINYSVNKDESFSYSVKDSTVILRIPSFMGEYTNKVDSLYTAAEIVIKANPYLIVDVRNNGGGNSFNFTKLTPYLYTKPIANNELVELYATQDIIQLYEEAFSEVMKDSTQVNEETLQAFREALQDLKQARPNSFVKQLEEEQSITLTPLRYPKKVAIVYNRACASACEDLLFMAKKSDKTLLLGDNSGGFVGYGNVFTVFTPCYSLGLSCSTTRYSTQWQYEVIGIEPHRKLDYNLDWVAQALKIIKE